MASLISKKISEQSTSLKYILERNRIIDCSLHLFPGEEDNVEKYSVTNVFFSDIDESEFNRLFFEERTLLISLNKYNNESDEDIFIDFKELDKLFDQYSVPESKEKNKFGDHSFNKIIFLYNGTKLEQLRICTYDKNHKDEIENYIFSKDLSTRSKNNNNSTLKSLQISSHFDVIKNVIIDPIAFPKSDWSYTENSIPGDIYDKFYTISSRTNYDGAIIDGGKSGKENIKTDYFRLMNEFYDLNTNNFNGIIGAYKNPYINYKLPGGMVWNNLWNNRNGKPEDTNLGKYFKQLKKTIIRDINDPDYLQALFTDLPRNVMMTINVEYSDLRCDIIHNPSDIMLDYLEYVNKYTKEVLRLQPFYNKTKGFNRPDNKNNRAIYRFYNK